MYAPPGLPYRSAPDTELKRLNGAIVMTRVIDLKTFVAAAAVGAATLAAGAASAGSYTPIAPYAGAGTSTGVNGINDAGYITGVVGNADGSSDGFIRTPGGVYTLFQVSGPNGFDTYGRDINSSNVITGYSTDSSGTLSTDTEFTRSAGGVITTLSNPMTGAPLSGVAGAINASGEIVGDYIYTSGGLSYRHGYLLNGSNFTDISASPLDTEKTEARGINDAGNVIVGFEKDVTTGDVQGFVDTGGVFQFVSDPSATNSGVTYLESINDSGLASGEYVDTSGILRPFIYNTLTDVFTDLSPPVPDSYFAFGINNLGEVTLSGQFTGANFLYNPMGVPEPATWALMLVGLGGLGGALRARREAIAAA